MEEGNRGMVMVDNYYINDEDLEDYIRFRRFYVQKAIDIYSKYYKEVIIDYSSFGGGEVLRGIDQLNQERYLISLSPESLYKMKGAFDRDELEDFLLKEAGC